jgi:hypothetical protein
MIIHKRRIKQFCPKGHDTWKLGWSATDLGCNKCKAEYSKLRGYRPLIDRKSALKRKFGITLEQYNELFVSQKGLCLGCYRHQSEFRRALSVDHNHATRTVRGLLCSNCNFAIGYSKDSPEVLRRLAEYLERHI